MLLQVIRFVRLPLLLLLLFTIGRFILGLAGVPYFPRGTAIFSVVVLSLVSSFYFGALSGRVGGFGWGGALLVGVVIGFWSQVLIFVATLISYLGDFNTYFRHWDALNVPEGTMAPMGQAMRARAGGLLVGPILTVVAAAIGRSFGALAPDKKN
ncbi:MAG: hypothetical protein L0387_02925 [Acidobacteria bacterium]|nr:hypothetical protein [Acidobacteriota bacterium]MCI0620617.1 hypothetical protein [Acidobacteriota bacterium]MCI0721913.1 hypothetical protein [Acidobacteriota bacterium]